MKVDGYGVSSDYQGTHFSFDRGPRVEDIYEHLVRYDEHEGRRTAFVALSGKYGKGLETMVSPRDVDHMFFFSNGEPWTYSGAQGGDITSESRGHYVKKMITDPDGNKIYGQLHTWIMNPPPGKKVDHINSNTLDNRRSNLRITDDPGNSYNKVSRAKSGYRGIIELPNGRFRVNSEMKNVGKLDKTFDTLAEARAHYKRWREEHGIFLHKSKERSLKRVKR